MKRIGSLTADSVAMLMMTLGYKPDDITAWVEEAMETGEASPIGIVGQLRYSMNQRQFIMYVDTDLPVGDDSMPPDVIA